MERLEDIAQKMVAPGQGILAADESSGTIEKRFTTIGVASTPQTRRDYREMLFSAQDAMSSYISGVILYDETLRQKGSSGAPLVDYLHKSNALVGIKVDQGAQDLNGFVGEKITYGLDGLSERLKEYYDLGARFAKWRAVIAISSSLPSRYGIAANTQALARYAALCQAQGIVPIVEPEVLMDGAVCDHTVARCEEVTEAVLCATFEALREARVRLEGMILKPNMCVAGKNAPAQPSAPEVCERTVRVLKRCVPAAVPGIAFLSGGQSDVQATEHLSLMAQMGPLPWTLTFSYGRALQAAALKAWGGKAENVSVAQQAFYHRARMNGCAALGQWSRALEG